MKRASGRTVLPLAPLLQKYLEAGAPEVGSLQEDLLGPRVTAILHARNTLLAERFLVTAAPDEFACALTRFYEQCVSPPLHRATVERRAGLVRHGLNHLACCPDPVAVKLERCINRAGTYHVPGLGPAFWSALAQAIDPVSHPAWLPETLAGLVRLGLIAAVPGPTAEGYRAIQAAYHHIRTEAPGLTALHIDLFLARVSRMQGRTLPASPDLPGADAVVMAAVREVRARLPLRARLKERGAELEAAREQLETALANEDGEGIGLALRAADPVSGSAASVDWAGHGESLTLWVGRLWEADDPGPILERFWQTDPVPGAGTWLPAAVLCLKTPRHCYPWDDDSRRAIATLDDSLDEGQPPPVRYRLFQEALAWLRERHRLHPLEVPDVLSVLAERNDGSQPLTLSFGGFCGDTFRFLEDLAGHNQRSWMERNRDRYAFTVREPLVELCKCLTARYVLPVLEGVHDWVLETEPRTGKVLTSICKNDYGRTTPYQTTQWLTFYRKGRASKRDDVQFFVRLGSEGLGAGLRLGRTAREANRLFRRNIQQHAELLFRALSASGAVASCRFGAREDGSDGVVLTGAGDLRTWAVGRALVASSTLRNDDPLLECDELVGEIILTFDRLLPAYACAVMEEPEPFLRRRLGTESGGEWTEADFCRDTFLRPDWLDRTLSLLQLKRQIILQGVPGTGKTHVARSLARLLTHGREEAVRLVQFHPSYSYEEFVEGIKVKSVEVNGRHEVTYPVEEGMLCAFANSAVQNPSQPHVLLIDEINRGNLPRVFGELLYLLEYRDEKVALPYSRREFRLPANLYLIGTMNAADRSVALVDQALRRRFSFVEMEPDARVLAEWLRSHPPDAGDGFARRLVSLFERLNAGLRAELGGAAMVGHSYFMVPDLDDARLRVVWEHQVRPLIDDHFRGRPDRAAAYDLDRLLAGESRPRPRAAAPC